MSSKKANNFAAFNKFSSQYNGQGYSKKELSKMFQESKQCSSMDYEGDGWSEFVFAAVDVVYAQMIQIRELHFNSTAGIYKDGAQPTIPQNFAREEIFDIINGMTPQEKNSFSFKAAAAMENFFSDCSRVNSWVNEMPTDAVYPEWVHQRSMDAVAATEENHRRLHDGWAKEALNEVLMKRNLQRDNGGEFTVEHIHAIRDTITIRQEKGMRHTFSESTTTTTKNAKGTSTTVEQKCRHEEYSRTTNVFGNKEKEYFRGTTTVSMTDTILDPVVDKKVSLGGLRSTTETAYKRTYDEKAVTSFADGDIKESYTDHQSQTITTTEKNGLLRESVEKTLVNEKGEVLASTYDDKESRHVEAAKGMATAAAAAAVVTETVRLGVAAKRYANNEIGGKELAKEVGKSALRASGTIAGSGAAGFAGSCASTVAANRLPADVAVKGLGTTVNTSACAKLAGIGAVTALCTVASEKLFHDEKVSGPPKSNGELAGTCAKQLASMSAMSLNACKTAGKTLKGSGAAVGAIAAVEAVSTGVDLYKGKITKKEAAVRVGTSALVTAAGCAGTALGTALTPVGAAASLTVGLPVAMSVGCAIGAGYAIGKAWSWWNSDDSSKKKLEELEGALKLKQKSSLADAKKHIKALLLELHPDKRPEANGVDVDGNFSVMRQQWEEYCALREKMDLNADASLGESGRKAWRALLSALKCLPNFTTEQSRGDVLHAIENID